MELANLLGIIGVIISNLLGLRIGISYWKSRSESSIVHEYNEYLFYLSFASCINWIYYGILTSDIYVFTSCVITVITTFGFIQMLYQSVHASPDKFKLNIIETCSIIALSYWLGLIGLQIVEIISINLATKIMGLTSMIISFIKNFSPCLVLYKVITSRNTELIYFPQAFLGFINVTIWLCYSIWIEDVYQILSNGASALVCLFQLVIYWWINCSYNKVGIQDFESGPDIIN